MLLVWGVLLLIVCVLVVFRLGYRNREKQRKRRKIATRLREVMKSEKHNVE